MDLENPWQDSAQVQRLAQKVLDTEEEVHSTCLSCDTYSFAASTRLLLTSFAKLLANITVRYQLYSRICAKRETGSRWEWVRHYYLHGITMLEGMSAPFP